MGQGLYVRGSRRLLMIRKAGNTKDLWAMSQRRTFLVVRWTGTNFRAATLH